MLALAKQKDFGTVAKQTMGGVGRAATDKKFQALLAEPRDQGSSPAVAMVKWLMSNPNLIAAVIATNNFDQLQENAGAARQSLVSSSDRETLGLLAAYNQGLTSLLCADCVSRCPEHLAVAPCPVVAAGRALPFLGGICPGDGGIPHWPAIPAQRRGHRVSLAPGGCKSRSAVLENRI